MELNTLYISRDRYNKDKPIAGHIEFTCPQGKMEIILTEEHCHRILEVMADALVEQATEAANNLKGAVIEATSGRQLTHQE